MKLVQRLFESRYRVYWEDTDAGGVVYHSRYLNFMERARTDCLLALGLGQAELKSKAERLFVVTRVEMDFLAPARLEDELVVETGVQSMRKASMVFSQTITRGADQLLLNRALVSVACLDATHFKPARLPEPLVAALKIS